MTDIASLLIGGLPIVTDGQISPVLIGLLFAVGGLLHRAFSRTIAGIVLGFALACLVFYPESTIALIVQVLESTGLLEKISIILSNAAV